MSISSRFYDVTGNVLNKAAKSSFISKKLEKGISDPVRFASAMFVTSIVSKDLVGCALYTAQSYYNDKIPEEKRKFVAALDLMNGIIMVGGQFFIGKVIDAKVTPWLTSLFTGKKGNKTVNSNAILHPDKIKETVRKTAEKLNMNVDEKIISSVAKTLEKACTEPFKKGFGILAAAIATTALTKRTLAPLISTPLAGWFKEKFMDKKPAQKPEESIDVASAMVVVPWSYANNNSDVNKTPFSKVVS